MCRDKGSKKKETKDEAIEREAAISKEKRLTRGTERRGGRERQREVK